MAVLLTRSSIFSAIKTTMPTSSRTVWFVVAACYLLLLIDAAPTTVVPMLSSSTPAMKPEVVELNSEGNNFTLKINLPSNSNGMAAGENLTIAEPEVIVRGHISAEYTDIRRRLMVNFEADGHGNTVKFHLEPSLSIGPKLGAMTLKNTVG